MMTIYLLLLYCFNSHSFVNENFYWMIFQFIFWKFHSWYFDHIHSPPLTPPRASSSSYHAVPWSYSLALNKREHSLSWSVGLTPRVTPLKKVNFLSSDSYQVSITWQDVCSHACFLLAMVNLSGLSLCGYSASLSQYLLGFTCIFPVVSKKHHWKSSNTSDS